MTNQRIPRRRPTRRDVLRWGGQGALLAMAAGGGLSLLGRRLDRSQALLASSSSVVTGAQPAAQSAQPVGPARFMRLAATDGFMQLPGRGGAPLYVFGFVHVPVEATISQLDIYKGLVQVPSPIIAVDEVDTYITVTNIGLQVRPDLDDSHTVHWHGFRNPLAVFDGVPEVSIAVAPGRDFPYFYRAEDPGTYMYHCHFEDTEHVQMGMDGIVYIRPNQGANRAYNDGDGSTEFDREFTLLLNDIDTVPHDGLAAVQEFIWSDYEPNYWVINGRSYPDTLLPNNDPAFPNQPLSSLIQVNAGDRVLLRWANLGYQQQAMQCPIRLKVVGEDATLLRGPGGADLSYETNTVYIGPGEARDALFTAPALDLTAPGGSDSNGAYNRYWLKNRNQQRLTNGGASGPGGQITEIRVYGDGTLPDQTHPNQTYPEFAPPAPYLNPWIIS